MVYTRDTTGEEIAKEYASSIKGKAVLITGVTLGGIGSEFATIIAPFGPELIVLAGRSLKSIEETIASIRKQTPNANLRPLVLDLSSVESCKTAAKEVNNYKENIDVLVNNAGIMASPYGKTVDGFEIQFGTNHLGHFLFTNLIMSKILASSEGGRIVSVSSCGHYFAPVLFDDVGFANGEKFNTWLAYGQSKTANMLFAVELAKKYKAQKKFCALSVHPGGAQSNLARHVDYSEFFTSPPLDYKGTSEAFKDISPFIGQKTLSQGAATELRAAFDPSLIPNSGSYMLDCRLANETARAYALDAGQASKLWDLSNKLLGTNF